MDEFSIVICNWHLCHFQNVFSNTNKATKQKTNFGDDFVEKLTLIKKGDEIDVHRYPPPPLHHLLNRGTQTDLLALALILLYSESRVSVAAAF